MGKTKITNEQKPQFVQGMPLLNIYIIKDNGKYMVKCPELDIVTEMDTAEQALDAILEIIREYSEDYRNREEIFIKSPNRFHHKPYVDKVLECKDKWELCELITVKYGHIYIR
ncbi:hypothetical protein KsCSTR_45610 [Candidatus Kuenenia stuttgartiensis]|jgi:predicted RNase H-like HicB family nuclease|uniref:Uncharacterized protein n=1 Tax=Kuenenia stuttgartiensis TaxID=174633 RepID=Q1PWI1_KUEST|nr:MULTISPECIES: hypothetical protein [Kuenenia]MBE7545893.1 hypothetical protein [Planctomycetia bacterium]MBZ0193315.1 hypothetical protein [Candidatus Kuenenia stuttgartiensis]MCF6152197.1 hypothetical protein [Candidatus Kuenenia stuttgartiensis]MCL4727350.1 hypothetical protein [Candidatus Kuenenia stuttgartiensis]MCZ7622914.1 hypothetical protein [Candidatus Kuenenia sp.]